MAAPTPSARVPPGAGSFKMPEGYQALITFSLKPDLWLWEKAIKPPSPSGGEPIDTTTQLNVIWRTMDTRKLKQMKQFSANCAYDPDAITDLISMINAKQTCTVRYPDNTTLALYSALTDTDFGELQIGEQPMVALTVVVTNWDPVNRVEAGPVLTVAAGT